MRLDLLRSSGRCLGRMALAGLLLVVEAPAQVESPYASGPCPARVERATRWLEALPGAGPDEYRSLVQALVRVGSAALPVLEAGLEHRSYEVRRGSIDALGSGNHPRGVPLLTAFAGDPDRTLNLRISAIRSLGRLGTVESVEPLLGFALGNEPELRAPSIAAIASLRSVEAAESLLSLASRFTGPDREKAIEALQRLTRATGPGRSLAEWERWWRIHRYRVEWADPDAGSR